MIYKNISNIDHNYDFKQQEVQTRIYFRIQSWKFGYICHIVGTLTPTVLCRLVR